MKFHFEDIRGHKCSDDRRAYKNGEKGCALEYTGKIWTRLVIRNLIKYLPGKFEKKKTIEISVWKSNIVRRNNNKKKRKSKFHQCHSDTKMDLVSGTDGAFVYMHLFYMSDRFRKNSFLI